MFRDLLLHVDGSAAGRRRVQFAIDLARRTEARLSGLHVRPPTEVPPRYKPSRVAEAATNTAAKRVLDAHAAATVFREEAPDACWLEAAGEVVECISEKARYADMVIIGQYEWQGPCSASSVAGRSLACPAVWPPGPRRARPRATVHIRPHCRRLGWQPRSRQIRSRRLAAPKPVEGGRYRDHDPALCQRG